VTYEGLFIIRPDLDKESQDKAIEFIKDEIAKRAGKIESAQGPDKKQMAYAIKKYSEGFYYLLNFSAPTKAITELNNVYKLNNTLLRHFILKKEA
jgi:small subunit ribosomal protein S6